MKRIARAVCGLFCALLLSLQAGGLPPVSAAEGDTADVIISVGRSNEYRYAIDILFRNISFIYSLESIAVNSRTGERYINSGRWLEQGGAPSPSFDVVVVNRSDTPISADTEFSAEDFAGCGADITVKRDRDGVLPAVAADSVMTAFELKTSAVFGLYPELSSYAGEKSIAATVTVDRADGTTTDGYPFRARKK